MFFGLRRRRPSDASAQFQNDVLACTRALGRKLPPLGKRYSMQVFTIALAIHLRETLMLGLREGQLTEEQAEQLVSSLLQPEPDLTGKEMSEPGHWARE